MSGIVLPRTGRIDRHFFRFTSRSSVMDMQEFTEKKPSSPTNRSHGNGNRPSLHSIRKFNIDKNASLRIKSQDTSPNENKERWGVLRYPRAGKLNSRIRNTHFTPDPASSSHEADRCTSKWSGIHVE
ncbi:hypothetical protein CDAR_480271 [Caerostris darwini]|uniref:Uncharacterized protein n=1 Tax=Caerostris darwini TaxID=1538125 RepID=A0AAV4V0T4_9ARAC|nr:hypothetical protein CDAR_480271 [Caerostris darwini]